MKTRFLTALVTTLAALFAFGTSGKIECPLQGTPVDGKVFGIVFSGPSSGFGAFAWSPNAPALEPNLGQFPASAYFSARSSSWTFETGLNGDATLAFGPDLVCIRLDGATAPAPAPRGEGLRSDRTHYLLGADQSKWITDVPRFDRVRYPNAYPGIDAIHSLRNGRIETDFEVRPGADPARIRIRFEGVKDLALDPSDGSLKMRTASRGHEVRWGQTRLFQPLASGKHRSVAGRIRILSSDTVGFETGDYDRSQTLVIDPVFDYLTYAGRAGSEGFTRMATDANGNLYAVGATNDPTYPVSAGAFTQSQPTPDRTNATLVKLSADGSRILYTTHFGGAETDVATGIAVDPAGNLYVAGFTNSSDLPVSPAGFLRTVAQTDRWNAFVLKFNPDGNRLLYGTYLGGSAFDAASNIAVDSTGAAYVTGVTQSPNFPVTPEAFQTSLRAGGPTSVRAFITKLNPAGSGLVYSTFLGGSGADIAIGLAVDSTGAAYVSGATNSGGTFPVTPGAAQTVFGGSGGVLDASFGDAFAAKLSPDGSRLIYSTYIGGRNDEVGFGIAVDAAGSAYISGSTLSVNFPVTAGALQTTFSGGGGSQVAAGDGFLVKLNSTGSAFTYATYLGGARDERAGSVAVDRNGNAWVVGHTMSLNFPVTPDAQQRTFGGSAVDLANTGDGFVAQVNPTGSRLLYSTYVGGAANEYLNSVAIARDGGVLFSGSSSSRNLPVTPGAAQRTGGVGETIWSPFGDGIAGRISEAPPRVTVARVANLASLATGVVSPGLPVVIEGAGFGPASEVSATPDSAGLLPKTLAGTRILFDGVAAPIVSVSERRAVAIVPYAAPASRTSTQMTVENGADRSAPVNLALAPSSPGIVTVDGSGIGQARAWNDDSSENSPDAPSAAGGLMTLLFTGAGETDPPGIDGLIVTADARPSPVLPVFVLFGDLEVEAQWAAAMPDLPAGYTILQVQLPDSLEEGAVEVRVRVGAATSQRGVTVAVRRP